MSKMISKDVHEQLVERASDQRLGLKLSRSQSRTERRAAFFAAVDKATMAKKKRSIITNDNVAPSQNKCSFAY